MGVELPEARVPQLVPALACTHVKVASEARRRNRCATPAGVRMDSIEQLWEARLKGRTPRWEGSTQAVGGTPRMTPLCICCAGQPLHASKRCHDQHKICIAVERPRHLTGRRRARSAIWQGIR
eukprot:6172327-Pleurochrysis_carterae.AAC.4